MNFTQLSNLENRIYKENITTFYFKKNVNENKEVFGTILVDWFKEKGISYELFCREKRSKTFGQSGEEYIRTFTSILKEKWFAENLNFLKDYHAKSYELSSIFKE